MLKTDTMAFKYVAFRVLERWKNLKDYFLNVLPKQERIKHTILKRKRYQSIRDALNDELIESCISFFAFVTQNFELFLLQFLFNESLIHILFPNIF